ncbi:uncharacterized protein LOC115624223 [Scaptodrosophila lebanonensis]|uniref:Uncharacterized protein LOC115624223 n=1 Tax=Drosophila lebanonensis TaxID=7225 RepID=A0A6J2TI45_DROLE|nr:uncharacterized protein LOC115624223 [Scaptodrosophila lebanonensis]
MDSLDSTLDSMQNNRFAALYNSMIRELTNTTHLSQTEVTSLLMVYYKFVMNNGRAAKMMTKKQFYQIFLVLFNLNDMRAADRTLLHITKHVKYVDPAGWIQLFTLFTTGDLTMRMKFAFAVYNTKGTGLIDREMISVAVERFFIGEDEDEVMELRADMCELIIKKFDVDKDGFISFDDYVTVVSQQPCLLEFLGRLFPSVDDQNVLAHCTNIDSLISY